MQESTVINEDNMARIRDLLECMEKGDEAGSKEILDDLTDIRESSLYQEVGKLTRELHDAISAFGMDDRISNIAEHDIPDARERLNFVISKTDEAANITLGAIEEIMPLCDDLVSRSQQLDSRWKRFTDKELNADEFRNLVKDIAEFLQAQQSASATTKAQLNDVLMAQDFQDLTGQIIKRVINLVAEVEGNLVNLIKVAGIQQHAEDSGKKKEKLAGPVVPGLDDVQPDVVSGQDEVDDLLSSLGF